jgi:hypothetical protein
MSAINEALGQIQGYRDQHGVDPVALHVSFSQWQALKAEFDAFLYVTAGGDGIDRLNGVKIEIHQPLSFKPSVSLEQRRHLRVVEALTGKRLPPDQYGVVVIDTKGQP